MDEVDIITSSGSVRSCSSEDSLCATALPYSTLELLTCAEHSSSDTASDQEEHEKQLKDFQTHVERERACGEHVPFVFRRPDMTPLRMWLDHWGPFPVHTHLAARITKDVASALLVLHSVKYSFGPSLLDNIYLDKNFHSHLLLEHAPRPGKVPGRFPMEDDMFRLGEILHRLVTGRPVFFDEQELQLVPVARTSMPVDVEALKLVHLLLSCHTKNRPSPGGVCHSPWPKEQNRQVISFLF